MNVLEVQFSCCAVATHGKGRSNGVHVTFTLRPVEISSLVKKCDTTLISTLLSTLGQP